MQWDVMVWLSPYWFMFPGVNDNIAFHCWCELMKFVEHGEFYVKSPPDEAFKLGEEDSWKEGVIGLKLPVLNPAFVNLRDKIRDWGFPSRVAAYDFRRGPLDPTWRKTWCGKLQTLIKNMSDNYNNRPVAIVGHSMGCNVAHRCLKEMPPDFRQTYVYKFIANAPAFVGSSLASQAYVIGQSALEAVIRPYLKFAPGFLTNKLWKELAGSPSFTHLVETIFTWPSYYDLFPKGTWTVTLTSTQYGEASITDGQFFKAVRSQKGLRGLTRPDKIGGQQIQQLYSLWSSSSGSLPDPGVSTAILYVTHKLSTLWRSTYNVATKQLREEESPGDTQISANKIVELICPESGCKWNSCECLIPTLKTSIIVDHLTIWLDSGYLEAFKKQL